MASPSRGSKAAPALSRAERNIAWCEKHIRIPEGRFVGQPLRMAEFMREDFRLIFDNPHGTRRAIISRGRKNAKTTETALLMLLFLCGPEARPNSQLFSAAQSRDQASVLFALAAKMIRMSPDLHSVVTVRDTAKQLYCAELGTLYRALSADASTAFGLSPVFIAHDELGQVKGPTSTLYEALETATAAQENPLSVIISTQAPTDADLLSTLIDDARSGADPRTVLRLDTAPDELETFSEDAIRAANPAFDVFMNKAEVLAMMADASRMPSRQPEFENLVLNRRVESASPFVSRKLWDACAGDPGDLRDVPVYAGLDLSSTSDLTAFVMIGRRDGVWGVRPTFWLPGENIRERARLDKVSYDVWHEQGFLERAPGKSVDYEFVAMRLASVFAEFDIRRVAFDRWNFQHLRPWLVKAGLGEEQLARFVEFGQGTKSMSPALRSLEAEILNERIAHGGHPVLRMCAANARAVTNAAGDRKLDKLRSSGRIDGMVALAMAFGVAPLETEPEMSYLETGTLAFA